MNTALLIVDIQNDYFPAGKNPLEGSLEASMQARRLLETFRQADLPVVHIRHISIRPGAAYLLPGTLGADIHENVLPLKGEAVFQKHFPNSFRDTPLLDHLHQHEIERLVICGMMTHMCVDATVRAAFDYDFECWVAEDACATRALAFEGRSIPAEHVHYAFLAALRAVYARVLKVEEIIEQLAVKSH
jgi:nicotinamidase-related amidase